jgi:DTW domain-containing protein YfiP
MRSRRLNRCQTCGLSESLCVCGAIPTLFPRTRIVILTHRVELTKSTNTGKLVARMLGERVELARSDSPWEPRENPGDAWVLFPSDDALPLEQVAAEVGSLVVPDGTWPQSRRMGQRHPRCKDLKKVRLTSPLRSAYALRNSSPKETRLCTLEAVAHALRILEGDTIADLMLAAFAVWVERALRVRAGAHNLPITGTNAAF